MPERKLGRVELKRHGKVIETYKQNAVMTVRDGYSLATFNPGGGGWGSPLRRQPQRVANDVRNGIVSIEAARAEYGVVIDPESLAIDFAATEALRAERQSSQHQ
jgi:N-methylhydantoinase B